MLIKKLRFILASLVCLLCVTISFTQSSILQLVPDTKHDYTDGITQDKLHKFGHLFRTDPDQAKSFTKFNRNRKIQRWVNYISGTIVGVGLVDGFRDIEQGGRVFTSRFGVQLRNAFLVSGIGNVIAGSYKKKAKQQLLMTEFYHPNLDDLEYVIVDPTISVGLSQISKNKFVADGQTGRLHDFGHLFKNHEQLKEDYDLFNSHREKQVAGNTIAVSIAGIGILGGALLLGSGDDDISTDILGALTIIGGLGIGGLTALIVNAKHGSEKAGHRSRLLAQIDPSMVHLKPKATSLNIAFTQNGLGLVYQF